MNLKSKIVLFLATGGYAGKIPFAPGTFGTIAGFFPCFLLSMISCHNTAICIIIFIIFAVLVSHEAEKIINIKDPGIIVIDEIAGIMITMFCIPFNIIFAGIGFILFRFFDILKPFPIRFLDKKVPGGTGIVLDDLVAGIFSNIILRIIYNYSVVCS